MILAVAYDNGEIFQHFGRTETFKVYDIQAGEVVSSHLVSSNGQGHGALAGVLFEEGVRVLICGGIGGGAQMALADMGIILYGGCSGDADKAVEAYLKGELEYVPGIECDHHHHEEGHSCGSSGCGGGCHGCHH